MNWLWSHVDRFKGSVMPDSYIAWGWVRQYSSGVRLHRYFMIRVPFLKVGSASRMMMWFFDWQKYLPRKTISFHHWLRSEQ